MIFSRHQITIIRRILENGRLFWNQSGFTVVSNFSFWNHLCPKVGSSDFGGFFFSRPKNDQNLAQIHNMLGRFSVIRWIGSAGRNIFSLFSPIFDIIASPASKLSKVIIHKTLRVIGFVYIKEFKTS